MSGKVLRVIGLGQRAAGDDAVGLAVVDALETRSVAGRLDLVRAGDAAELPELLETSLPVVIVDAVVSPGEAGRVSVLPPEATAASAHMPLSSHGLGVRQAVELARILSPSRVSPSVQLVAVAIDRPARYELGLSEPARAGAQRAAEVISELALREPA